MLGAGIFVRKSMMVFVGCVIPTGITSIKFYMYMYAQIHKYYVLRPFCYLFGFKMDHLVWDNQLRLIPGRD